MSQITYKELEAEIERSISMPLRNLPHFAGLCPHVSIHDKNGRKKRHSASAENWSADSGEIRVNFDAASSELASPPLPPVPDPVRSTKPDIDDPTAALIRSLDSAESKPGYDFVALKWFRDSVLPAVRPTWMDPGTRAAVLRDAIERRIVLTSKVPNPKSPMFPVTAIRLNRSLPEVQTLLGPSEHSPLGFQPVAIRGEALSTTVLRERR
jgi:hypothetical protein